ncbi:coiled-coil domain-containing protein 85A isoform X2 [Scleropages formosus]|uniref:coiled-coil domain-containing protein 85A isoform X2 n=1 Tax=Scleropages formosus TaxID=113540 RepID=UPI0010FAA049|nr:coiled-coil domain-containing protein 85B-like isoform X2 [Scleropages formosus]
MEKLPLPVATWRTEEGPKEDISQLSDQELLGWSKEELVRRLRSAETRRMSAMLDHSNLMRNVNRRLQQHLGEIRELKEVNRRLQQDNEELRDLCCFLDDERQKGRCVSRQWQRLGRYGCALLRTELPVCLRRLQELETRQEELLKELCVLLDEERGPAGPQGAPPPRDLGDGSSASSTGSTDGPDRPDRPQHERQPAGGAADRLPEQHPGAEPSRPVGPHRCSDSTGGPEPEGTSACSASRGHRKPAGDELSPQHCSIYSALISASCCTTACRSVKLWDSFDAS